MTCTYRKTCIGTISTPLFPQPVPLMAQDVGVAMASGAETGSSEFQGRVALHTLESVLVATCFLLCFPEKSIQSPHARKPNNSRRLTYSGGGIASKWHSKSVPLLNPLLLSTQCSSQLLSLKAVSDPI